MKEYWIKTLDSVMSEGVTSGYLWVDMPKYKNYKDGSVLRTKNKRVVIMKIDEGYAIIATKYFTEYSREDLIQLGWKNIRGNVWMHEAYYSHETMELITDTFERLNKLKK